MAVFDALYELQDEALHHRLSKYGTVLNIRRCNLHGYDGIQSGTRVVKMDLVESIPSFMRFGQKLVRVKHEGQVPTCRKCHLPDHVARSCPNTVCFNCDKLGHAFRDCPEVIKCSICKEDSHYAVDCCLSWWRRIETAADNEDNEENLSLASAVLQPTLRLPAGDLPIDVSDRATPLSSSSSSSLPTASSVPPSSPDAPIDVSESATAVPVSSGTSASSSSAA